MSSLDWRAALLAGLPLRSAAGDDATGPAALSWAPAELGGHDVVVAAWDFAVAGGSFGQRDATTWLEATDHAVRTARPVVALVRSGGTRLTEGVPALVGMARATLARQRLAAAGVPLLAVADAPTTGGVLVTVVSRADLRVAVAGATVGFAGPRVVAAVTGAPPDQGSHTAEAAAAHGLVDAVVAPEQVPGWLASALTALSGRPPTDHAGYDDPAVAGPPPQVRDAWEQVLLARAPGRPGAGELLARLVPAGVDLAAPHGDRSVAARVGRLAAASVVGVALAADRGGRPTPDGYRLLARAAGLADRLDLPLLTLVDTPGAEPGPQSERDGLAGSVADAFHAVLTCRAPTLGVLVGEGGSGGALAALVCDVVLATPSSYFAALVPEGAAVALRLTPQQAAERLALRPTDVLASGVVDALVPDPDEAAFLPHLGRALGVLSAGADGPRRAARDARWSAPAPGP